MADKNLNINIIAKDKSKQALNSVQGNLNKTKNAVSKLKVALIAIGAGAALRSIINITAKFEDLRTALSSVTGSARSGAEAFSFISKFATETQFGVDTLTETFIKLKAAGIEPTRELLTTFTDTAAVTTDQIGSLNAMTDLFARSISGGLGLEDLNRLADRGVPVFKILEEQLGITRLQVAKFGQTTKGAETIRNALVKGLNEDFGGATKDRLGNLSTVMSNFSISVENTADLLGMGMAPALKKITNEMTELITKNEELVKTIGKDFGGALLSTIENTLALVEAFTDLNHILEKFTSLDITFLEIFTGKAFKKGLSRFADEADEMADALKNAKGHAATMIQTMAGVTEAIKDTENAQKKLREGMVAVYGDSIKAIKNSFKDERQLILKKNEEDKAIIDKFLKEDKNITTKQKNELEDLKVAIYKRGVADIALIALKELEAFEAIEDEKTKLLNKANKKRIEDIRGEGTVLENLKQNYAEFFQDFNKGKLVADALTDTFAQLTKGIGDAVAQSIVFGKSFKETFGDVARQALASLISALVQVGVQMAFNAIISAMGMKTSEETTVKSLKAIKKEATPTAFLVSLATGGTNAFGAIAGTIATFAVTKALAGRRTGGQVTGGTPYMVGEQGQEMFVPNQSGTIVPNDKLGGGQNINITINANDTQGFDELLVKRRATIVNVINDALNSQGKEALV